MRVNYLVEEAALFGGVKLILQQANLLFDRGHRTTVVTKSERPWWFPLRAGFRRVPDFSPRHLPPAEVNVATYWTTVEPAINAEVGQALQFCQGFEFTFTHNVHQHDEIRRVYAHPIPAMVGSPHLIQPFRTEFRRVARWIPTALAPDWRPRRWVRRPRRPPRILVVGPFENEWKGVATALEAVLMMRRDYGPCRLVRLSQWPLSDDERGVVVADEFHHALPPSEACRLVRGCDLLLAPSWEQEEFGLPVLEAMASGVPVVASDIEAFRAYAASAARLVPWDRPEAFAAAAIELLHSPERWRRHRRAGVRASRAFSEPIAAQAAEEALQWTASGAWRHEMEALE